MSDSGSGSTPSMEEEVVDVDMVEGALEAMVEETVVVVTGAVKEELEMKKLLMVGTLVIKIDSSIMNNWKICPVVQCTR